MVGALAGTPAPGAVLAASAAATAVDIFIGIVVASWVLMFALFIGMPLVVVVTRGRRLRRRPRIGTAPLADPQLPAVLARLRAGDPRFDERLLLEAAQMACLVIFAAMATGDEDLLRRVAVPSFWSTFFGRYVRITARDVRLEPARRIRPDEAPGRVARLPVDYQASAPELIRIDLGAQQRATVRVSFSQLRVGIAPGVKGETAMAAATSLKSLARGAGQVFGGESTGAPGWISWAGRYDLMFARPGAARTDPDAALSSRTCGRCGRPYRSELATACAFCGTERPLPWGQWRLTDLTPVDGAAG